MKKALLFILFFVFSNVLWATSSPTAVIKNASSKILSELQKNKSQLKKNKYIVNRLVHRYLLPHVDVYGMSRTVLGRNVWKSASKQQRKRFTKAFTQLVVRTYSGALRNFDDEKVKVYPLRGGYQGKRFVRVRSVLIKSSGQKIPLNYNLVLKGSRWKVYDMSVEGVSILHSFRNQFAQQLRKGSINELTVQLGLSSRGGHQ